MTSPGIPLALPVTVTVASAAPYDVIIGRDLQSQVVAAATDASGACVIYPHALAERAAALITALEAVGVHATGLPLPDGEAAKTLDVLDECWTAFSQMHLDRQGVVIGFGGGTITDLAGFAAATWMRGVPVIQVPTTLLAMVDAAVGGKTGINTAAGKNMVGAFHEPLAVIADLDFLVTLPEPDLIAGMVELVKCGFIADTEILDIVEADRAAATDPRGYVIADLVRRAVIVKADVVAADLKESDLRENLNYGHTLAHAIEKRENYQWRHGHAVAVGMIFVAELAAAAGILDAAAVARHRRVLELLGLPTSYEPDVFAELVDYMGSDKKTRRGQLRFVILQALGSPTRLENPDPRLLAQAWAAMESGRRH